jgi:hypothetical protein
MPIEHDHIHPTRKLRYIDCERAIAETVTPTKPKMLALCPVPGSVCKSAALQTDGQERAIPRRGYSLLRAVSQRDKDRIMGKNKMNKDVCLIIFHAVI